MSVQQGVKNIQKRLRQWVLGNSSVVRMVILFLAQKTGIHWMNIYKTGVKTRQVGFGINLVTGLKRNNG